MARFKMDAVEIATLIYKGNFSKLRGKSFEMCDNKNMRGKYTLNQLGNKVDQLSDRVDQLSDRVDQLAMTVDKLAKIVVDGFKRVNARIDRVESRIDHIDVRLDYIVKANNLKDLPKSK